MRTLILALAAAALLAPIASAQQPQQQPAESPVVGSNKQTGGEGAGDRDAMKNIQDQAKAQKDKAAKDAADRKKEQQKPK